MSRFHPKAMKLWVRHRRTLGDTNTQIAEGVRFLSVWNHQSEFVDRRLGKHTPCRLENYWGSLVEQRYWNEETVFTPHGIRLDCFES